MYMDNFKLFAKNEKELKTLIRLVRIYHIYQPLRLGKIWHKVNFKRSLTGLNSEFSFS